MRDFRVELYRQMITLGRIRAERLARQTGLSLPAVYKYAEGEISISLERANQIVSVTENESLARAMLAGTGFFPVRLPGGEVTPENLEKDQLSIIVEAARAIETIQEALEDGKISGSESLAISEILNNLQEKIESLRSKIKIMEGDNV